MIDNKFKLLAGPCVIESEENVMLLAQALKDITSKHDIDFYFKASWDKANRTKATNYRGPGLQEGLRILEKAKTELGVRIVTDIHLPEQAEAVAQVADIIVGFVNSYLVHVKSGVILGFGLLVMLWTVMMLISNVETTFNDIWGVKNSKGLLRNLVDYTAFFFLLPIVVVVTSGISIFITTSSAQLGELVAPIVSIGIKVLPYVIMSAVFIAIYMLMPNTKVKFRSALMPGIIAGVAMQILQLFYIHSQIWVSSYNAIYGSFAALPLFMLWMQISWIICLFGAQLCYTNQNLDELAFLNSEVKVSHAYKMMASAWLLSIVCKQFGNEFCKPLTPRQLHLQTGIPMRVVSSLLNDLQAANLVDDVSGGGKDVEAAYKPAETLDNITMGAMVERLEAAGVSWNDDDWPLIKSEKWEEVMRLRNDYLLRLRDIPVKAF